MDEENYGGTMNHALKTVLPVKEKKKAKEQKTIRLALHPVEAKNELAECERKHKTARAKLLVALLEQRELEWETATQRDVCFRVRDSCDGGSRYCKSGE